MILTIDIGNSRIKWGLWQADRLAGSGAHDYLVAAPEKSLDAAFGATEKPDDIILACVAGAEVEAAVQAWLEHRWHLRARLFRTSHAFADLTHGYQNPEQHGADRWAAMIAARALYRQPVCVISCGTAVTIDVINAAGKHLGGQILPGAELVFASLGQRLPALAAIDTTQACTDLSAFASNTRDAVTCGVCNMLAAALDRASDAAREMAGEGLKTLLTGGGAPAMMALMKTPVELQPDLVLRGLCIVAQADRS